MRPRAVIAVAVALAGCRPAAGPWPPERAPLAERVLAVQAEADPSVDLAGARARLAALARDARTRLADLPAGREQVRALNRFFFDERGFAADADVDDPDALRLDRVLERHRGSCAGLAAVYIGLAELLRMPVRAVAAPGHVFLRYDDGASRINIETQEGGREISDATYRKRYRIPDAAVQQGVFLTDLTDDRFMSQIVNNLGTFRSRAGDPAAAAAEFRRALELDPLNVTAIFNLAREQMQAGDLREAAGTFGKALELNANDFRALNNRGVCRLRLGDRDGAVADFLAALAIEPGFAEARRNLEAAAAPR